MLALGLPLLLVAGCEGHISPDERNRTAHAYADMLFYQAKYPTDSLLQRRAVDSAVRARGFDDLTALKAQIDKVSLEPDDFRTMLDSTQRYLDAHQQIEQVQPPK